MGGHKPKVVCELCGREVKRPRSGNEHNICSRCYCLPSTRRQVRAIRGEVA